MELNLADLFEAVVDTVGSAEALVCGDGGGVHRRQTYEQLEARANQAAHLLTELGIGPGDAVGLHLYNGHPFIEVMLACYKLRAVPVNLNYRYVADELAYLVDDAELRAVFTEPDLRSAIDAAVPLGHGAVPAPDAVVVADEDYEDRLAAQPAERPEVRGRSADDHYLLYTGGTTGPPKGVLWRHEDIYYASLGGRGTPSAGIPPLRRADELPDRVRRGDPIRRRLPLCPLIHGGAMWVALQTLLNGGALVLDTSRHFDAATAVALLSGERVELTMLIGDATARPIADAIAADRRAVGGPRLDLSALQVVASGGAILSTSVKEQLRALLGHLKIVDTYGASETGGQGRLRLGPDGSPKLVTDEHTAVLGDDLRPVRPGQVGRLARSGWVPLGYQGDPERTAATFPVVDGVRWSLPGDQARLEPDGTITVLGHGSTCINTGGEKVFPEEVENVLKSHPAVFDALVVGVPDPRYGQRIVAVWSARPEAGAAGGPARPGDGDLEAHVRQHLAGYKVPRAWVAVEECRRFPTGKPDYAWARAEAEAAASSV